MKNIITFNFWDGYKVPDKWDGHTLTFSQSKLFNSEIIRLETEQILFVGDYIKYKSFCTKVSVRYYFPENDMFNFLCDDIYTGRKE